MGRGVSATAMHFRKWIFEEISDSLYKSLYNLYYWYIGIFTQLVFKINFGKNGRYTEIFLDQKINDRTFWE